MYRCLLILSYKYNIIQGVDILKKKLIVGLLILILPSFTQNQLFAEESDSTRIVELEQLILDTEAQIAPLKELLDNYKAELKGLTDDEYKEVTYAEVARDKNGLMSEKISVTGKVIQVMEGDGLIHIRLATGISDYDGDYNSDDVYYIELTDDLLETRILEDDILQIKGVSYGIYTYQSTLGGNISIPSLVADEVTTIE